MNRTRLFLLIIAGLLTCGFNGIITTSDVLSWLVDKLSGPQFYLLLLEWVGQYEIIFLVYTYFKGILEH